MAQVKLRTDGGADLQSALIVNAAVGTGLPEDFSANQHSYLAYYRHTAAQNANNLSDGWHDMKAYVTNCATTSNHGTFIQNSYGGTPFQIWIPDANDYIYKRYSTTGFTGGEGWKKLSAGYADSAPWTGVSGRPTAVSSFTNDAGYITGITKATVTAALGYTPPTTNTTYSNATTSAAGLMSAADKIKLNGVETGANKYSLPTAATGTLGGVKVGANITIDASGVISPTKTGVTAALGYTPLSTTGKAASAGSADSAGSVPWTGVTNRPTAVSSFTNDAGYITGITKAIVTAALGYTPPTTNTTYSAATTTYAGLVKVGNNITIDASGVISPTKTGVTAALGYTPPTTNTTYSVATTTYAGLVKVGNNISADAAGVISPTKTGVTAALGYTPPTTNTTYSAATTTYAGLVKVGNNISIDSSGIISPTKTGVTAALGYTPTSSDTKNTAGATNTTAKIFLVGATTQGAGPQTYSNSAVYATNGDFYATKFYVGGTVAYISYNTGSGAIEFNN